GELRGGEEGRGDMGLPGRRGVVDQFSFAAQADRYCDLFDELCGKPAVEALVEPETDDDPPAEYGDPVGKAAKGGAASVTPRPEAPPATAPRAADAQPAAATGPVSAGGEEPERRP